MVVQYKNVEDIGASMEIRRTIDNLILRWYSAGAFSSYLSDLTIMFGALYFWFTPTLNICVKLLFLPLEYFDISLSQ